MADVLSVIADIIKQDKQQKREHAKVMREVQKKLKEKETDASEDVSDFMGAASQAAADGKKEFEFPPGSGKMYPVTIKDKDTAKKIAKKMDDEDEQEEETTLSQRVKDRMKAEQEDDEEETLSTPDQDAEVDGEEDEDDDPVGGEPSEDQIDKIADLVVQKLKDKADEEEDEEDEPEETEAEKGEEEEINTRPKMEAVRNPHARNTWEEALRKVYFKEEKVPEPIPEVIKNVGKELRNYAMKSGGIDRDDFLKISKTLMQGKMPKANMINKMDTDPREFVFDLMAKTMGWKYVEQYGGIRFQHRTDYVESFQGGHVLQEHCGECGAMDHVDEKKMFSGKGEFEVKYASSKRGPIKVSKFNTLDDAKKFLAQVKGEGMNGIISKGGKPIKEHSDPDMEKIVKELEGASKMHLAQSKRIRKHIDKMKDAKEEVEIDEKMDGRKKFSGKQAKKDNEARRAAQRKKLGILGPNEEVEIQEDWLDNAARKIEKKWMAKDSKGKYTMNKRAKMKWIDDIMVKADRVGMTDFELEDALDDYGIAMDLKKYERDGSYTAKAKKEYGISENNLDKLEDWGISIKKEGYMVMPAIDREKYTPMRGLEGPFPTFSGKVLYYDPKAGMYYDRDSDIYLSYDAYLEYDKISPSQQKQMKLGPLGDPKSKEYKSMEKIKKKVAKLAKRDQLKNESVGMRLARKFYQKEKDNVDS